MKWIAFCIRGGSPYKLAAINFILFVNSKLIKCGTALTSA